MRERLIDTAIIAFERDGFSGTSLSTVAGEAGFSRGAVYSNFASKEDLFLAALERNAEARIAQLFDKGGVLFGTATATIDAESVNAALGVTHVWSMLFVEFCIQAQRDPDLRDRLAQVRRRMRQQVIDKLRGNLGKDGSDQTCDELAVLLMAMNNGLMIELLGDAQLDPSGVIRRVAAFLANELRSAF